MAVMRHSIIFGGVDSADYGIYISGEGVFNAPRRDVEMTVIPGRNGALSLDHGRYENISVTYPAFNYEPDYDTFAQNLSDFRNAICSQVSYQRLEDTFHPGEYRMAAYTDGLEVDPIKYNTASQFDLTFNCKPQRFLISGEEPVDTSELGGEVTTNRDPYLFRRTGGGSIGHDFDAEVDKIVGGTVAWNQLVSTENGYSKTVSGLTLSMANNKFTISGTPSANGTITFTLPDATKIERDLSHHKVLISKIGNMDEEVQIGMWCYRSDNSYLGLSGTRLKEARVVDVYEGTTKYAIVVERLHCVSGTAIETTPFYPQIIDLTTVFGTEIADYVYSLEQTSEGSGIAWLKSHGFLTKDYYAYNTGSLLSVKTSAHVMRDENDAVIATYSLDPNLELRGIPKLSNGSLYYDGDVYESSGAVKRKYGIVDLGTLNWGTTGGDRFVADRQLLDAKINTSYSIRRNAICNGYLWYDGAVLYNNDVKGFSYYIEGSVNRLFVKNTNYSTAEEFKTAMSGVYLVYELATPTTETAQPYASPQVVNPLGTEEYIDTRDVPVPVGHETKYGMSQLVLTNPTEFPSKPLLEVTGVGTFWLGDTLFTITGTAEQTIYIDCETGESWKNVGGIITPANGLVTLNRLDFPELDPGDTPVMYGTGITKVVVTPRWWII